MKLKTKKPTAVKDTKVIRDEGGVRVWHSQEVKQSLNYQSASVTYGVELRCEDDKEAIEDTIERAEKIVEASLLPKFKAQGELLNRMTKADFDKNR